MFCPQVTQPLAHMSQVLFLSQVHCQSCLPSSVPMSNGQGSRSYVCLWTPFALGIPGVNRSLLDDTYPGQRTNLGEDPQGGSWGSRIAVVDVA